jgi:hypothetical protein
MTRRQQKMHALQKVLEEIVEERRANNGEIVILSVISIFDSNVFYINL